MSAEILTCKVCNENYHECDGDRVICDCGEKWCSTMCAELNGYKKNGCSDVKYDCETYNLNGDRDCEYCEYYVQDKSCGHCRGEIISDEYILEKALFLLKMTKEDIENLLKEERGWE